MKWTWMKGVIINMEAFTDHTKEVERRLAAIHIHLQDNCAFFKLRNDALVNMQKCQYCTYGLFNHDSNGLNIQGLCKVRK